MLGNHTHAALQLSGGKDSLALLHLARPYLDRITVFFGDTGAVYPHVSAFVHKTCADMGANLVVVKPQMDVIAYTEKFGLPSDIVPIDASPEMAQYIAEKPKQPIQSSMTCCGNMLWLPMLNEIRSRGIKLVLRGSKGSDAHVTAADGSVDADGIEYRSPIWDWSDEKVMAFMADKPMPDQYPDILDSMDCWVCTAYMNGKYAGKKLAYAKAHYPDLWPALKDRINRVRNAVAREVSAIDAVWEMA